MLKENISEEEKRKKRIEIFEEYEKILKYLDKNDIKITNFFFNEIEKKEAILYYKEMVKDFIYDKIENEILATYFVKNTLSNLEKNEVTFEDLAPILYIHLNIYGGRASNKLRHVIIDEAQDYGEFQFSVLKTILNSNSMTILGDIAQGVHFYRGIEDWQKFIEIEFPEEGATFTTLEKTYRTTKEIMDKANKVISKLPSLEKKNIVLGEPVIYGKDSIHILKKANEKEIIEDIVKRIKQYKSEGYKSFAIIGKDMYECKDIKKRIDKYIENVKLIKSKDSEYFAGISVVPSYLAKGLEFDAVMLYNVDENTYKNEILDIKLLYVAITRAMSKLDAYYIENLTELLK